MARDAQPLLNVLAKWQERDWPQAIPRTLLAEVIGYALNQYRTLTV